MGRDGEGWGKVGRDWEGWGKVGRNGDMGADKRGREVSALELDALGVPEVASVVPDWNDALRVLGVALGVLANGCMLGLCGVRKTRRASTLFRKRSKECEKGP